MSIETKNEIFPWEAIGDLELGRPNLGGTTLVAVYRLMQYTMRDTLESMYDEDTAKKVFQEAGRRAGMTYCAKFLDLEQDLPNFISQLNKCLLEHGIGILRIEEADMETLNFTLTVSEDLDCSGLPVYGKTVCDYDEGFIAGILYHYTKKEFSVKEVDCWATGDRTCRFEVLPKEGLNE